LGLVTRIGPRAHPVPYLQRSVTTDGCTSIHFGENQLSPGSIGISPLSTGHPPVLQHWWVRASTRSYPRFTLPMESSPGFGSHPGNPFRVLAHVRPVQTRFRCGSMALCYSPLNLAGRLTDDQAANMNSPDHSTKGTPSAWPPGFPQTASRAFDCLWVLGFRVSFIPLAGCFSPFPHGTRALSVARGSLALEGGPPSFPQDFACPVVLRDAATIPRSVGYGALTRLWHGFPAVSPDNRGLMAIRGALQPHAGYSPTWFRLLPVRSPLLRESPACAVLLISLPRSTEMFQFLRCPPRALCIQAPVAPLARALGCPIRIRTAHRLHAAPRPRFAVLRVLLRPRAPRHPPNTPPSLAIYACFSCVTTMRVDPSSEASHPYLWICDALSFSKLSSLRQN
jgi:hypothetical protein